MLFTMLASFGFAPFAFLVRVAWVARVVLVERCCVERCVECVERVDAERELADREEPETVIAVLLR
jgi:hypothetical protein